MVTKKEKEKTKKNNQIQIDRSTARDKANEDNWLKNKRCSNDQSILDASKK
ncbi:MAG: hypothetical protein WC821_00840 [archaeon]|jgi:hypothetical protein